MKDALDRFKDKLASRKMRATKDAVREKPRYIAAEAISDGYLSDRERDAPLHRFMPEERFFDPRSNSWVKQPSYWYETRKVPHRDSAIPRQMLVQGRAHDQLRAFTVTTGSVTLWIIEAHNWHLAHTEAVRLCDIAGYDHRRIKVRG